MAKPQDRNALFDEMLRRTLDRYPVTLACRCEISAANTDLMEYVVRPMLFEGTRDGVRLISQRGHLAHKSREIGMRNHDQKAVVGSEE